MEDIIAELERTLDLVKKDDMIEIKFGDGENQLPIEQLIPLLEYLKGVNFNLVYSGFINIKKDSVELYMRITKNTIAKKLMKATPFYWIDKMRNNKNVDILLDWMRTKRFNLNVDISYEIGLFYGREINVDQVIQYVNTISEIEDLRFTYGSVKIERDSVRVSLFYNEK